MLLTPQGSLIQHLHGHRHELSPSVDLINTVRHGHLLKFKLSLLEHEMMVGWGRHDDGGLDDSDWLSSVEALLTRLVPLDYSSKFRRPSDLEGHLHLLWSRSHYKRPLCERAHGSSELLRLKYLNGGSSHRARVDLCVD